MGYIYVLSRDGSPLMPTLRRHHVEKLLRRGKARVVEHVPFVIQLMYDSPCVTQPLYGGTDPGRTNIGNAVINSKGTVVYKDHVTTRNKEVARLMAERRQHRQASRRGERLARKRLANKLGTTMKAVLERVLPGCDGPVKVKDIINTEARFNNRSRPKSWVTPSVRQLIRTHVNMVKRIKKYLPVCHWTLELNKFAFMQLDDGSVYGTDFQNGKLRGYRDVKDYIWHLQGGKCLCCKKAGIDHYHHILPRGRRGSDLWYNIAGLCADCHDKLHRNEVKLPAEGERKRYAGTSVLNQAVPFILKELEKLFPSVDTCTGRETAAVRELLSAEKAHADDAVCIAAYGAPVSGVTDGTHTFEVRQFRRHDRALIRSQRERTYQVHTGFTKKGEPKYTAIAKNRKPRYEQQGPALSQLGLSRQQISVLHAVKSKRLMNDPARALPGAEFFYEGKRYIKSGQSNGGAYFRAVGYGEKNFRADRCTVVKKNRGLVYVL